MFKIMQKIKKINEEYQLVNVPDSYSGIENMEFGYIERTDLHVKDGFLTIVIPTTTAFQQVDYNLNNGIADVENGTFTYGVIEIPQQTAQQLYDALIEQGKQVFDEFSIELSKAAIPYNILNNHPEELKELTRQLLAIKEEIKVGLKYYLDNNMIEQLQAFNYNDERAEMLRNAINDFK